MANDDTDATEIPEPRANHRLIGHEQAEKVLLDAVDGGRLHHAWLITGPRGIGKATLVYRLARYMLAKNRSAGEGGPGRGQQGLFGGLSPEAAAPAVGGLAIDPGHPVFSRVAAASHGDLLVVERSLDPKTGQRRREIVVDDVRAAGHFLSLTPAEGGCRIVVIDAADEMNPNAANAILKILEEPPTNALILLVCHNFGGILPTIRSRCRRLPLKPLDDTAMMAVLAAYLGDTPETDRRRLCEIGEGSAGRALGLAASGGVDLLDEIDSLLRGLPELDVEALYALGGKVAKTGNEDGFVTAAGFLRWWLGRMIALGAGGNAGGDARGGDGPAKSPSEEAMARLWAGGPLERWLEVWDKVNHLLARTDRVHLDRKQVLVSIFLSLQAAWGH